MVNFWREVLLVAAFGCGFVALKRIHTWYKNRIRFASLPSFHPFLDLPIDLQKHVLSFVAIKDWSNVKRTCKHLLRIGSEVFDPSILGTNYPLLVSCRKGNVIAIDMLLRDPRVNPVSFRNKPLRDACEAGRIDVVKHLLKDERVASFDDRAAALRGAAKNDHHEVVRLLFEISSYAITPKNLTELGIFWSGWEKPWAIARFVKEMESVTLTEYTQQFLEEVLMFAGMMGLTDLLEKGLSQIPGQDVSYILLSVFHFACRKGRREVAELILRRYASPDVIRQLRTINPLHIGCESGNASLVRLLMQDLQCDPSLTNNLAVRCAISLGHADVVEVLLEDRRVDPRSCGYDFLLTAIEQCKLRIALIVVRACLRRFFDVPLRSFTQYWKINHYDF